MERFPSLINSLKTGFEEGRPVAELINLLDQMRYELSIIKSAADHTHSPVSVWFPAGYQPPGQQTIPATEEAKLPQSVSETVTTPSFISGSAKEPVELAENAEGEPARQDNEAFSTAASLFVPAWVPRPPLVKIWEEEEMEESGDLPQQTGELPNDDDFLLPGNIHVHSNGVFRSPAPGAGQKWEKEQDTEEPMVVELTLPEEPEMVTNSGAGSQTLTIAENFLKQNSSVPTEGRPLELHEILANRVVARPAIAEPARQAKVLADSFAGGKITDLRKAIAINDRFRFINSLFRGDDSLFERSVKTINNFNVLQEAQYWMQRELVIKLGWNEEDELVQMFYQLVSRRFL